MYTHLYVYIYIYLEYIHMMWKIPQNTTTLEPHHIPDLNYICFFSVSILCKSQMQMITINIWVPFKKCSRITLKRYCSLHQHIFKTSVCNGLKPKSNKSPPQSCRWQCAGGNGSELMITDELAGFFNFDGFSHI